MLCLMKLNLQFLIVSQGGTELTVRQRGVGGGFMHLSYQMGRHGRYALFHYLFMPCFIDVAVSLTLYYFITFIL